MGIDRSDQDVLAEAAAPVLERIEQDAADLDNALTEVLSDIRARLFSPSLNVSELERSSALRGGSAKMTFRLKLGESPRTYIESRRLEVAIRLLGLAPHLRLASVADRVGYGSSKTFRAAFKRRLGVTPNCAREIIQEGKIDVGTVSLDSWERQLAAREKTSSTEAGKNAPPDGDCENLDQSFLENAGWQWLIHATPEERQRCVALGFRFETTVVVRSLMKRSREDCRDDRQRGVVLAEGAVDALGCIRDRLQPELFWDLWIEALSNLGHVQCLAGDWGAAEKAFSHAELELRCRSVSPDSEAAYLTFRSYFKTCQRRPAEALPLLDRAYVLKKNAGRKADLVRILMNRGRAYEAMGELGQSIADYGEALALHDEEAGVSSFVSLAIYNHLANSLHLAGRHEEALGHLYSAQKYAEEIGETASKCRLTWLEGSIAAAQDELALAEGCLKYAWTGLISVDETTDAALLAVDLATVLLRQNRFTESRQTVCEALPTLKALALEEEGFIAIKILEESLKEMETISAEAFGEIAELLKRSLQRQTGRSASESGR